LLVEQIKIFFIEKYLEYSICIGEGNSIITSSNTLIYKDFDINFYGKEEFNYYIQKRKFMILKLIIEIFVELPLSLHTLLL
jgi:hypothetical protein